MKFTSFLAVCAVCITLTLSDIDSTESRHLYSSSEHKLVFSADQDQFCRRWMGEYQENITTMGSRPLKVIMFLGSARENRLGQRVAKFMEGHMKNRKYEITIFDPVDPKYEFEILRKAIHYYKDDRSDAPAWLVEAENKIRAADAYLVVSAEYNHSIPPALSNMFDHFPGEDFAFKPSAIVCYSPSQYGGMRAAMQLRALLGEMGCLSISRIFGLPKVHESLDANGVPTSEAHEKTLNKGAESLLHELEWHAHAMRNHRDKAGLPKL